MKLYYDLELNQLLHLADQSRPVRTIHLKRGDAAKLEIAFVRDDEAASIGSAVSEMKFVAKAGFAEADPVLIIADDWSYNVTTDIWSSPLQVNGSALTTLLGADESVDLYGEFTWTDELGGPNTSQTIAVKANNDLWKGTEDTPLILDTPEEWLAARALPLPLELSSPPINGTGEILGIFVSFDPVAELLYGGLDGNGREVYNTSGTDPLPTTGTAYVCYVDEITEVWTIDLYFDNALIGTYEAASGVPIHPWDADWSGVGLEVTANIHNGTVGVLGQFAAVNGTVTHQCIDINPMTWQEVEETFAGAKGRYCGMMSSPPLSGDYLVGDWINTYSGDTWTCINSGNPGIWQTPDLDSDSNDLIAPTCHYGGERVYPGVPSTPTVMYAGRTYAVTYPLNQRVAIDTIRVGVTGAGYNGAKILAGIYEDNHGNPKKLLASGEVSVDVSIITAAKVSGMATMGITMCDPVTGIPETITVANAGTALANGVYTRSSISGGFGEYINPSGYIINYSGGAWRILSPALSILYSSTSTQNRPNGLVYTLGTGANPLPYVTGKGMPVTGGRWVWVVLLAVGGSGAEPVVQFMNSSPYYPCTGVGYPNLSYNGFALYKDGHTALPERFNRGGFPFGQIANASPRFSMAFAVPTVLPSREPDRHLAVGPTLEDEMNCLQEPNVYYDPSRDANERYVMTYTIRWGSPALAWATAPHPRGPWTKKGVFWEDSLGKSSLLFDNGVLYVYSCGASLTVRSGPNPGELGAESVCLTAAQLGAGTYQNTHVLKRGVGDYILFVEANVAVIGWATGYATGANPLGPFTMQVFPVTGLQRHPSSTYGGPCCNYIGGVYRMWIHSGEGGINPTEIYHCTSTDLITWTGSENPVIRRESRWEVDQVADPHFFRDPVSGLGYLYWDALDNFMPRSVIMVSNPNVLTIDE